MAKVLHDYTDADADADTDADDKRAMTIARCSSNSLAKNAFHYEHLVCFFK